MTYGKNVSSTRKNVVVWQWNYQNLRVKVALTFLPLKLEIPQDSTMCASSHVHNQVPISQCVPITGMHLSIVYASNILFRWNLHQNATSGSEMIRIFNGKFLLHAPTHWNYCVFFKETLKLVWRCIQLMNSERSIC